MKTAITIAMTLMVGCMKPIPPKPEVPQVIAVVPVPEVTLQVDMDASTPEPWDGAPPRKTWLSKEEAEEMIRKEACECQDGDPLCSCL